MSRKERKELGKKGRNHVMNNYSMKNYVETWDKLLTDIHQEQGSWDTRKIKLWSLSKIL